jgi:hypothetical protein
MILLSASAENVNMPLWALIPFVLMLAMIAVGPLMFHTGGKK